MPNKKRAFVQSCHDIAAPQSNVLVHKINDVDINVIPISRWLDALGRDTGDHPFAERLLPLALLLDIGKTRRFE